MAFPVIEESGGRVLVGKGVKEIILLKEAGDSVDELRSNLGKTGHVITTANTREEG